MQPEASDPQSCQIILPFSNVLLEINNSTDFTSKSVSVTSRVQEIDAFSDPSVRQLP